jgi:hypothetical protein
MRKLQHARRFAFYAVTAQWPLSQLHCNTAVEEPLLCFWSSEKEQQASQLEEFRVSATAKAETMRRFDDAWVVDRTMFEYLNQVKMAPKGMHNCCVVSCRHGLGVIAGRV